MTQYIFIAQFKHGTARLAKVPVVKEAAKTYMVDTGDVEKLIGWQYVGKRVPKEQREPGKRCFTNGPLAMMYLAEHARKHVTQCEEKLRDAIEESKRMDDLVQEVTE